MLNGDANILYANTQPNENTWLQVHCIGTVSNRSAIGTRIRIKAMLHNQSAWQIREISSQTGFGSQNSLVACFGLDEDTEVDSIQIIWPSGIVWDTTGVAADQRLVVVEKRTNHPPVAGDDDYTIVRDSTAVLHVLQNDSDPDGNEIVIQSVAAEPACGSIQINDGDTTLAYTPSAGFIGFDSLYYVISDGLGGLDTGLVCIHVEITSAVKKDLQIMTAFALHQNHPNPFNPYTQIDYDLAGMVLVTLKIYDIRGKEVTTLLHKKQPAGTYHIIWDGCDHIGRDVPTGLYVARMTAGENVFTRRLLKIK